MKRTETKVSLDRIPTEFHALLQNATVYDSSCSQQAQVLFVDKDDGYYLKSAPKGTLENEAVLTRYFHQKQLGAAVLNYVTDERDWLLTARVTGEDCTHADYLAQPERLAALLGERLRMLHELDGADCPVHRTATYLAAVEHNFRNGLYDNTLFPDNWGYTSAEEAWHVVNTCGHLLKSDVLLHGDYCLPNIMLNNWQFSGFIDVGNGGRGDRHIDLFWGIWSLNFNLKTDRYRNRFLDAYGRDKVDEARLRVVAAAEVFG